MTLSLSLIRLLQQHRKYQLLQIEVKLPPRTLIAQFMQKPAQILTLYRARVKWNHQVVTSLAQLWHGHRWRTLDQTVLVEVKHKSKCGGGDTSAATDVILSTNVRLQLKVLIRKHASKEGILMATEEFRVHNKRGFVHYERDPVLVVRRSDFVCCA